MPPDDVVIRPLESHADLFACVALQRATWGERFRELVPPAMLMIVEKMGGILAGAFLDDRLVGFVFGITGRREGRPAHWSHMLAVDTAARDRGVGRRLKEYQRQQVEAQGIERMYWTFDPLVARNAHLNLNRLGARVIEYTRSMYGDDPDSTMDSIIGSDRFVVEWDLSGTGAQAERRTGEAPDRPPIVTPDTGDLPDAEIVQVAIPVDIQDLKTRDPDRARGWRAATRRAFEHYLSRGYRVRRLTADRNSECAFYVLDRVPE